MFDWSKFYFIPPCRIPLLVKSKELKKNHFDKSEIWLKEIQKYSKVFKSFQKFALTSLLQLEIK